MMAFRRKIRLLEATGVLPMVIPNPNQTLWAELAKDMI